VVVKNKSKRSTDFYKDITLIVLSVIFSFFLINMLNPPEIAIVEENVEAPQKSNDFPSTKEGTFVGTINGQAKIDKDEILLFHSAKVPGLNLKYYPKESRLEGGTPSMSAKEIILFDGNFHQVAYTFKRFSKQKLFFDGEMVAESDFVWYSGYLTGLVIGPDSAFISELVEDHEISGK